MIRPLPHHLGRRLVLVAVCFALGTRIHTAGLWAADTLRRGTTETALDRYVAQPDAAYSWRKVAEAREGDVTGYALDLVSQHWLTPAEVNRPEWRHWLTVVKPDDVKHPTALLFITGGSNRPGNPPRPSRDLIEIARRTRSVVAELRMIPNQSLVFNNDGVERKEDDLIAYSWAQYLRTGDERWPARLPMTKAAVRAMDAVTAFLGGEEAGKVAVETFVVAGASKRGWTTWCTAAVDRRVIAICPLVIDILNVETSINHHYRAYGFFAPSVGDYVTHRVVDWSGTAEGKALYGIEDPFSYRDRLTMPKLLINAAGDQFFVPDSTQFYFGELPGENLVRYVPNTDHGLKDTDVFQTLSTWYQGILERTPRPKCTWQRAADGTLTVRAETKPNEVKLWQATNPSARDFRLETLGPKWISTPVTESNGVYAAELKAPAEGWTASFVELTFEVGGRALKLTTDVSVLPDKLPFPAYSPPRPEGFLSRREK
jgi:PhoPQ-activated pathogenicity-related protein